MAQESRAKGDGGRLRRGIHALRRGGRAATWICREVIGAGAKPDDEEVVACVHNIIHQWNSGKIDRCDLGRMIATFAAAVVLLTAPTDS